MINLKLMVYNTYTSLEAVIEWLTLLQEPDEEYHFGFERKEDGLLFGSGSIGPDGSNKMRSMEYEGEIDAF